MRRDLWYDPATDQHEWREPSPPKGAYRIDVTPDDPETAPQPHRTAPEPSKPSQTPGNAQRIRDLAARLAGGDRSVRDELARLLESAKPTPEPTPVPEPKQRDPMADYYHPSWRRIE